MDSSDIDLDFDMNFEPRVRSNTWAGRPSRELEPQNSPVTGDESSNGGDQQCGIKDPLGLTTKKSGSRRNAWGNLSYADLITKAIQNSPEKRLTLSQIYEWMVQNVPYFKDKGDSTSSAGWKNSIRHNLSLHSRFMRIQNEGTGKSSWWVLNPDAKPGKTPRRRAGSMETKCYEKKRGRIRKKIEALRSNLENGKNCETLSPGGSDDYLDDLSFDDFRKRAGSSTSNCSRLSPIHAEPDLNSTDRQSMSSIPWNSDVSSSPTIYTDNVYSDLVESLVEGMKLSNQDGLKLDVVSGINGTYITETSSDYNGQPTSYNGVSQSPDNHYTRLPAPPPYPKQQQQQQQMNGLDFHTQNFNNTLRLQIRSSPVSNGSGPFSSPDLYNDEYSDPVLGIKQELETLSPVRLATPSSLSVNTQQLNCSEQGSPGSGPFSHHSPQSQLTNGLSPHACQVSPQQNRHHIQQPITTASLQQHALHQATCASILHDALTQCAPMYRPHTTNNNSSPTFTPLVNHTTLVSSPVAANVNSGLPGMGLTMRPNLRPHHVLTTGQLRGIGQNFTGNHIIAHNIPGIGSNNINSWVPNDIDMDLMGMSVLDCDMDSVIKQELTLEGNLDFMFDVAPVTSVGH